MTIVNNNPFRGTGVAIVTPFHRDGSIDFKSFENLINFQINAGVDYIVFMGTTGESVTLNDDEKSAILQCGTEIIENRVPVVVGIGGNNTYNVVKHIRNTDFTGVSALLSVSPYYNKPQPRGIYAHYKMIAEESPVPVIMYNVPGRTGSNLDADTTLKIANEIPNILGIKEASGNLTQCSKILKNRPEGFLLISGDDMLALPIIALGGDGVISVIANALPFEYSKMIRYCLDGDFASARKIHLKLVPFIDAIFADGSPSGVKALLEIKGLCKNNVRLPLVKINKPLYNQIIALNDSLDH